MADESTVLRGTVEQVIFTNPESGWTVLRLSTPDEAQPISVVGTIPAGQVGTRLEVTGRWQSSPKYGRQFRAETALPLTPSSETGIRQYLASGLVEGLGPALADRLVDAFGSETLTVIEKTPERLTEVEGIGQVRAGRIRAALENQLGLQSTMVFLFGLGIPPAVAGRIHRRYGPQTAAIVQAEPYRLALDVRGVGFKTADQIAARLGVDHDSPLRAQAGLLHVLAHAAQDGHVYLPRSEVLRAAVELLGTGKALDDALTALIDADRIVASDDGDQPIYAAPIFTAESAVVDDLERLLAHPAGSLVEDPDAVIELFEADAGIELADSQRDALLMANRRRIVVVTGGPGTGKTTVVRGLLALFVKAGLQIRLAAPTGRASKRMEEATGQKSQTLHRLLAYDPTKYTFTHGREEPLTCDALVIDEMSMVDIPLMAAFISAVPDRARLVLVGDVDQLPSVGPGQVLKDLIDSDRIPVVRLQRVFRQQQGSRIVENAHRINQGRWPELANDHNNPSDFFLIEREDAKAAQSTLLKVVAERIPASFHLDPFEAVQVLTPMHKGDLGASALNEQLQQQLNPDGPAIVRQGLTFRVGDKVMQTKNNYDLNVFNGDVGRLAYIDRARSRLKVVFEDREVTYEPQHQDALTLAYAMSIHKSQGSEYPAVVIPLSMQHFVMLHRNLLYTAVTRGKRLVVLIGSRRALRTAIDRAKDMSRYSGLARRLAERLPSDSSADGL